MRFGIARNLVLMVFEILLMVSTRKNTIKKHRLHNINVDKIRHENQKSPDFTGLFGLYETALNRRMAEEAGLEPAVA